MAESILSQIRGAEDTAEQIRKQAQTDARDMLKGTEEALRREGRQASAEQRTRIAQVQKAADEDIRKKTDAFAAQQKGERDQRMAQARKKLGIASAFVYGRIVNHGQA